VPPNEFARQVNEYIRAKAELFALLTSHTTITGAGRENALREFVGDLIPRRYEALTGTLAPAPQSGSGNSQVDLMIVNTLDFPVLVRDGGLAVVLPQSVEVTVEIKTDVDDPVKLAEALRQIRRVHRLFPDKQPPLSILFSYGRPAGPQTLATNLGEALKRCAVDQDGLRSATDLPHYVLASGSKSACIATLESNSATEVSLAVSAAEPVDTISYLLNRILGQLTPKPLDLAGPRSNESSESSDDVVVQARGREQAWSWINGYFDIEFGERTEEVIVLPKVSAPPVTGDE